MRNAMNRISNNNPLRDLNRGLTRSQKEWGKYQTNIHCAFFNLAPSCTSIPGIHDIYGTPNKMTEDLYESMLKMRAENCRRVNIPKKPYRPKQIGVENVKKNYGFKIIFETHHDGNY